VSEGIKFDGGKVRMDLLPPEFLFGTATILTFGAAKYSTEWENEWEKLSSVRGVEKIQLTIPNTSVAVVMRKVLNNWTLSTQNVNDKTEEIGKNVIPKKLDSWLSVEKMIQNLGPEIKELSGCLDWVLLDSPNKNIQNSVRQGAKYVEQESTYTLTIAMRQEDSEVYYVVGATTVLGCLETIWLVLKEQHNISEPLKKQEGDRNWELGMDWSRTFGALMRHMWYWWAGKGPTTKSFLFGSTDEETGHSHLWHAACCLAFLVTYEERNVGKDDRPCAS
tara:strand:+ start:145 stop:975 length:831 start_codon:yes stop_codon:yes gene_type:complete